MIDLDADTLTLKRRPMIVEQYDGHPPAFAIVQGSPVVSRRPKGEPEDWQIAAMQRKQTEMAIVWKSPDTVPRPADTSWCSACSYDNGWINNANFYRSGGVLDHYCRDCRKSISSGTYFKHQAEIEEKRRKKREARAKAEGRTLRPYFKQDKRAG